MACKRSGVRVPIAPPLNLLHQRNIMPTSDKNISFMRDGEWGTFHPDGTLVLPSDADITIVRGNMPPREDPVTKALLDRLGFTPPSD